MAGTTDRLSLPLIESTRNWDAREGGKVTVSLEDLRYSRSRVEDDISIVAHRMSEGVPCHGHDFYELCFVMDGGVINVIGDESLLMNPESLCVMNLFSSHSLEVANPSALIVNVCLRPRLFESGVFAKFLADDNVVARFMRGEGDRQHLIMADMGGDALGHSIRTLLTEYEMAGFTEDFRVEARVLMLLAHMASTRTYTFYGINERVMMILNFINLHCAEASVPMLAREFALSEGYLSQYVRKRTGRRITDFIQEARLERAKEMLEETERPVDRIARDVGYASYSHFHKLFVNHFGRTPGEVRAFAKTRQGA